MKKIILTILLIVLVFAGVLFAINQNQSNNVSDNTVLGIVTENDQYFSLEISSTDNVLSTYQVSFASGSSLADILHKLSDDSEDFKIVTDSSDFGELVTSINGITANTSNEWWRLQVNGLDSQLGISDYKPRQNDLIRFILTKS